MRIYYLILSILYSIHIIQAMLDITRSLPPKIIAQIGENVHRDIFLQKINSSFYTPPLSTYYATTIHQFKQNAYNNLTTCNVVTKIPSNTYTSIKDEKTLIIHNHGVHCQFPILQSPSIIFDGPNNRDWLIIGQKIIEQADINEKHIINIVKIPQPFAIFNNAPTLLFSSLLQAGTLVTLAAHKSSNKYCIISEHSGMHHLKLFIFNPMPYHMNNAPPTNINTDRFTLAEPIKSIHFVTNKILLGVSNNGSLYRYIFDPNHNGQETKIIIKDAQNMPLRVQCIANDSTFSNNWLLLTTTGILYQICFHCGKSGIVLHKLHENVHTNKIFFHQNIIMYEWNRKSDIDPYEHMLTTAVIH